LIKVRAWISFGLVTLICLVAAPAALADTATSSNWAGYAAHRSGTSFEKVSASWRQPRVSCTSGGQTYSAYWVGIGGFSPSSPALEQIGTEADCTNGRPVVSAWYELVPAPSTPISFPLTAGDLIDATVAVKGRRVTLSLYDATRHRGFTKTLTARVVDASSAEWIVEAPSECTNGYSCRTLPLANFGSATFAGARAQTTHGRQSGIASAAWDSTKIFLVPGGRQFVGFPASGASGGTATPSALAASGSSFKVSYSQTAGSFMTVRSASLRPVSPGQLFHPAR
jgi:hypothetical protein